MPWETVDCHLFISFLSIACYFSVVVVVVYDNCNIAFVSVFAVPPTLCCCWMCFCCGESDDVVLCCSSYLLFVVLFCYDL